MESSLNRVLDFKLVFESLCEGNGMVRLEALTARWPNKQTFETNSKIPDGCMKQWKSCADKDGYLDWDKFSTGLQLALKEDASRLSRDGEAELPQSEAERKLRALRQAKKEHTGSEQTTRSTPPLSPVGAEEIEMFLSACSREKLTKTLTRLRKDLYKGQLSIHRLTTSSTNSPLKKQHAQKGKTNKASDIHSTKAATTGIGGKSVGILSREKEELTQGLEVLEKTKQWYSDRLKQLAQEESHDPAHSKKIKAEELLVVLERGTSAKSEMIQHLKKINTHLESLASPAPDLTPEQENNLQKQLQKLSEVHRERASNRQEGAPSIGDAVVEWNQHDQQELVLDAGVNPSMPTFPVYTAEEIKKEKNARSSKLSSSMMEVHHAGITGPKTEYGKEGGARNQTHRYASSQNVSTLSTSDRHRYRDHHSDHDRPKRRTPKRSQSFTNSGTKSNPMSEITSSVTDYPVSHAQREASVRPQQYPLRETASMQEIPGGHRTASSAKPVMHGNKPIHPHSLKSSSVRNIPSSASSYGNRVHGSANPGIMHQHVYSSGMSHSTQTLPSSSRHHGGSHDPKTSGSQMRGINTQQKASRIAGRHSNPSFNAQNSAPGKVQSGGRQHMGDSMLSLV